MYENEFCKPQGHTRVVMTRIHLLSGQSPAPHQHGWGVWNQQINGGPNPSPPQNQAEAHYKGHKHARKLKAVEAAKSKQRPQTLAQDGVLVSPTPTPASGSPGESQSKGQS